MEASKQEEENKSIRQSCGQQSCINFQLLLMFIKNLSIKKNEKLIAPHALVLFAHLSIPFTISAISSNTLC